MVYNNINIYEDPIIGLGLGFLWIFIFAWGLSFFVFYFSQKVLRQNIDETRIKKDSYKLSLLFGIYAMINLLLISLEQRNKIIWLVILVIFILLHMLILKNERK